MNMKQKKIKIEPRIKLNYNVYFTAWQISTTIYLRFGELLLLLFNKLTLMSIYGQEALNICHAYMTDIQRYTLLTIWKCTADFLSWLVQVAILKSEAAY